MGAYHQMGHDSWNLISESALSKYQGVILSPVNDSPESTEQRLKQLGKRRDSLEIILDPQFYEPRVARAHLVSWPYFSNDVDTVNLSDMRWWEGRGIALSEIAAELGVDAVCSPCSIPRSYDDEYYRWTVDCAKTIHRHVGANGLELLLSSIVRLSELARKGRPEAIASILTSTAVDRIYLVFSDDLAPRAQRVDVEGLAGAVRLINLLENAGSQVLVAFCGFDMLLWKAAGAQSVASGKYFNLRRFVPGRFDDEEAAGGRVVPYWTDNRLITWLREDDVRLLDRGGFIDRADAAANPFSAKILEILDARAGQAWLAFGWRQFMCWFQHTEEILALNPKHTKKILRDADARWGEVMDRDILLFDRHNTGEWIRPWLNAINLGLSPT